MIFIGGGPGGYTAALYGARAGLSVLVIEKLSAGGQMALSPMIDNYPGLDEGIDGFSLGQKMLAGAERFGAQTLLAEVTGLELSAPVKTVRTTEGDFESRTVILSTGADPKNLGLPNEEALVGRGVSHCAACDGMFYKGKTVVVVGGGTTAQPLRCSCPASAKRSSSSTGGIPSGPPRPTINPCWAPPMWNFTGTAR